MLDEVLTKRQHWLHFISTPHQKKRPEEFVFKKEQFEIETGPAEDMEKQRRPLEPLQLQLSPWDSHCG